MKSLFGTLRIGRVAVLAALVVMMLSVVQMTVSAQEDLDETYVSETGNYQISFPSGWTPEESGAFTTVEGTLNGDTIILLIFDPATFTALTEDVTDLQEAAELITGTNEAFSGTPEVFEIGTREAALTVADIQGLEGLSFTVAMDDGGFGFLVVAAEAFSVIEENAATIFAIADSYNSVSGDADSGSGSGSGLGGLLGGGSGGDEEEEEEGGSGLGGLLGGSSSSSDSNTSSDEVGDTCAEFPLNLLNSYQWGIVGDDPDEPLLVYNIGCNGFMTYTVVGSTNVIEYEITRDGVLSFMLSETTYTTTSVDEDEWVVESSEGGSIPLTRIEDNGTCDAELADIIRGAWMIGSGADAIVFDFTCNGILLITNDGETQAATYTFDARRGDLTIDLNGNPLELGDVEIDGDTMEAIDGANNRLTFTNMVESE